MRAVSLRGNPVVSLPDFEQFVVWNLRALEMLDGTAVREADRGVAGRALRLKKENQLPSRPLRPDTGARDELLHLVRRTGCGDLAQPWRCACIADTPCGVAAPGAA